MTTQKTPAATAANKHKIPQIAFTAAGLVQQKFQGELMAIGTQAIESLGLNPADGWNVNFETGYITKTKTSKPVAPQHPSTPKKKSRR